MADMPYIPAGKTVLSGGGVLGTIAGGAAKFLPYVGPVLMGAQIVASLIGRGRKQADIWTKSAQEPFGRRMSEIIDRANQSRAAGTLTYEQAQQALAQYKSEVGALEAAASQFETLGSKQRTVIEQFRKQFAGPGYFADWEKTLTGHVEALKPAETKGPEPPPEEAPAAKDVIPGTTPEEKTPQYQAKKAATQLKKRAQGLGRSSTILGGAGATVRRQPVTLLGY